MKEMICKWKFHNFIKEFDDFSINNDFPTEINRSKGKDKIGKYSQSTEVQPKVNKLSVFLETIRPQQKEERPYIQKQKLILYVSVL